MKIQYLGTAASEGFPAVFCNCGFCRDARKQGGKNIRTRSQAVIDDELLIDFPADTYFHSLQYGVRLDRLKLLLVTHSHGDHFYPRELLLRGSCYAHELAYEKLPIVCGEGVFREFEKVAAPLIEEPVRKGLQFIRAVPFRTLRLCGYEITPLPANHMAGEDAMIYIVKKDKCLLYMHDTGFLREETLDFLAENKTYFDFVSLDCTNVEIPIEDSGSHMGLENIKRLIKRLEALGAINEKTIKYINHFSHNANPMHERLCRLAEPSGLHVAFDGCVAEF